MEKPELIFTTYYDRELISYLRLHAIKFRVMDQDTIEIEFSNVKYLWMMAVNYGRYQIIMENKKNTNNDR